MELACYKIVRHVTIDAGMWLDLAIVAYSY